jgi:outer membrane protein
VLRRCSNSAKLFLILASIHLCFVLSSCSSFDATSPQDYIGPLRPEPNVAPAAVRQKTNLPTTAGEANAVGISPAVEPSAQDNTLKITITQATLLALKNNRSLVVQQFNPRISRTFEEQQLSVFDPDITAGFSKSRTQSQTIPRPGLGSFPSLINDVSANVAISKFFPTGTTLSLDGSTDDLSGSFLNQPFVSTRAGVSLTQSLLRGFGTSVNLASVEQARLDTKTSQYELRGFVEGLVAQIEETYWDYTLAEEQIDIVNQSLEIAQRQFDETRERISVGDLAKSELVAAQAELALRQEDLINAQSTLAKTKLNLLQLINPPGTNLWNRQIVLQTVPENPTEQLDDVEIHVALAQQMRPELNQAKLLWQRNELEVVKTRNGLLPQLDLFITLGRTGYADSFAKSVDNIRNTNNYDITGGIIFQYPLLNRSAQAQDIRARVSRDQAHESINNLSQLVEVDVRNAYLEIIRASQQVTATAASRKLQEEKLQIETEKFKVGNSTSLLVAQAQRDFLASRIAEVQAVANHIKAYVELYRLEGSLLERRGIASPGREIVKLSETSVP